MSRKLPLVLSAALMALGMFAPQAQAYDWDYRGGWGYSGGYGGGRGYGGRNVNIDRQQERLFNQMSRGLNSGRLSQTEYNRLLTRYNNINSLETRLRADGLNWRERQRLSQRLSNFQNSLRWEMNDRNDRLRGGRWY